VGNKAHKNREASVDIYLERKDVEPLVNKTFPDYKGKKFETIKGANVSKVPSLKFTTIGEVSKLLGARV
jgi:hypothetical protein